MRGPGIHPPDRKTAITVFRRNINVFLTQSLLVALMGVSAVRLARLGGMAVGFVGSQKSFVSAVRSGDRLRLLRAQRRRVAEELDAIPLGDNPSGVATLMRQMMAVSERIAALEERSPRPGGTGGPIDELAARRRHRGAGAPPEGGRPQRITRGR